MLCGCENVLFGIYSRTGLDFLASRKQFIGKFIIAQTGLVELRFDTIVEFVAL